MELPHLIVEHWAGAGGGLREAGLRRPPRSLTLGEDEDAPPSDLVVILLSLLLCPRVSARASRAERAELERERAVKPRGPARQGQLEDVQNILTGCARKRWT